MREGIELLEKTIEWQTGRILNLLKEAKAIEAEAKEIRIYQQHLIQCVERLKVTA